MYPWDGLVWTDRVG